MSGGTLFARACPDEERISAFVDGTISEVDRARIDAHVASCPDCRKIIGALGALGDGESDPGPTLSITSDEIVKVPLHDLLASVRVGEILDRKWRLLELLGAGGMGQVFAAENVETKARVALKVLRFELAAQKEIVRRFVRERYAANRIGHPAFVRVLEDGTTASGLPYFVMDLVDGVSLRARVKRDGAMSESEVTAIGDKLLAAISAAHEAGVLHRDIKPDNVALDSAGELRILDFGIAKLTSPDEESSAQGGGTTITGQLLGTPTYMPPEQARGLPGEIDQRVDVFAVGATLFFLATGNGVRPTTGALFEAMTQPVPPVRTLAPTLSPKLARVLDRALAFDKHDRYPSAAAMRDALLDTAVEVPSDRPDPLSRTVPTKRPPPAQRWPTPWIIGGVAVIAVAGAGLLFRQGSATPAAAAPSAQAAASSAPAPSTPARVEAPASSLSSPPEPAPGRSASVATPPAVKRPATKASSAAVSGAPSRPAAPATSANDLPKDMQFNPYR